MHPIADCATEEEAKALAALLESHRQLTAKPANEWSAPWRVKARLLETVADMAMMVPPFEDVDSREVVQSVIEWAEEFSKNWTEAQDDEGLYLEKVEEVFLQKWKAKYEGYEVGAEEKGWNPEDAR